MAARLFGLQLDGAIEVFQCLVQLIVHGPGVAAIGPSLGVFRIELEGLAVVGDGAGPFAHPRVGHAPAHIGGGVLGIKLDGPRQVAQPFGEFALERLDEASIAIRAGGGRIEAYRLAVVGDCLVEIALAVMGEAAIESGGGRAGIKFHRLVQVRHGLVQVALHQQGQPAAAERRGRFRIEFDGAVECRQGVVQAVLLHGRRALFERLGRRRRFFTPGGRQGSGRGRLWGLGRLGLACAPGPMRRGDRARPRWPRRPTTYRLCPAPECRRQAIAGVRIGPSWSLLLYLLLA